MTIPVVFTVAVIVVGFGIGLYCQSQIINSGEGNVKTSHDLARWDKNKFREPILTEVF